MDFQIRYWRELSLKHLNIAVTVLLPSVNIKHISSSYPKVAFRKEGKGDVLLHQSWDRRKEVPSSVFCHFYRLSELDPLVDWGVLLDLVLLREKHVVQEHHLSCYPNCLEYRVCNTALGFIVL